MGAIPDGLPSHHGFNPVGRQPSAVFRSQRASRARQKRRQRGLTGPFQRENFLESDWATGPGTNRLTFPPKLATSLIMVELM